MPIRVSSHSRRCCTVFRVKLTNQRSRQCMLTNQINKGHNETATTVWRYLYLAGVSEVGSAVQWDDFRPRLRALWSTSWKRLRPQKCNHRRHWNRAIGSWIVPGEYVISPPFCWMQFLSSILDFARWFPNAVRELMVGVAQTGPRCHQGLAHSFGLKGFNVWLLLRLCLRKFCKPLFARFFESPCSCKICQYF